MWCTYLRILALDTLHLLESIIKGSSSLLKAVKYIIPFLLIKLVARLTRLWRINHQLYQALSNDRCTQADRHELIDLLYDFRVEADQLEIPSSVSTLTHHTLRYAVQ